VIVEAAALTRQQTSDKEHVMKRQILTFVAGIGLACVTASSVFAVGSGLPFFVGEGQIDGTDPHVVVANSMDFTYHSCVDFFQQGRFRESGYFWVSSYQDADSVVDSQINYFLPSGYRMYGIYRYQAQQVGGAQMTPSGTRLNYVAVGAAMAQSIELFVDVQSDTVLDPMSCPGGAILSGNADDRPIGSANALAVGEKSETSGLASGDLEIVFGNWAFTAFGQALFFNANFNFLVFNANITDLNGGMLNVDHFPEGSGNLFWVNVVPWD
jgi:hypothetical protein